MDEEPLIIAAMMAEEERRYLEKRAAGEKQAPLHDTYQQSQSSQPFGCSIIAWIVVAIVISNFSITQGKTEVKKSRTQ
ncbi:MAG: hypothetical protein NTY51_09410 [Deltaproteobacteria bacterium]|nr:hypothetical protein [Deltaproteobacteria bacterium]